MTGFEHLLAGVSTHRLSHLPDLTDSALKEAFSALRARAKEEGADALLPEAFALYKEAAARTLGQTPYDEQLLAGIAMHKGRLAQMQTGEGKTLAAVAPACLNALYGRVHILTFNDYLARRDCAWMRPVYEALGVSVAYINEGMGNRERRDAYAHDVVYLTAKEAGFDLLRDFLSTDREALLHKRLDYAIVDEADSILIDEGRIPLVIAGNLEGGSPARSAEISRAVASLSPRDYEINADSNSAVLTDSGVDKMEAAFGVDNLYDSAHIELLSRISCALQARFLLRRDVDYIVRDNQILLIDEFTGRVAQNRHYPDNLHDAVEAKEGLPGNARGTILGTIALQYFMRQYKKIAGMTGTATPAKEEFKKLYDLDITEIPTHAPCIRRDLPMALFTHTGAKWEAVVREIIAAHANGQPVLVGTADIEQSEQLATHLAEAGIPCAVLNAKNDEQEAAIIAQAGDFGAVTISTNMAGRGVDIRLGGADEQSRDRVVLAGGLYVIGTNMHESERIDNQLRGRAGRQGDIGASRLFVSLEDEIMATHDISSLIPQKHWPAQSEEPIEDPVVLREAQRIQRIAQGKSFDMRTHLLKYTYIIEEQRKAVFARRSAILAGESVPNIWRDEAPPLYEALCERFGEAAVCDYQRKLLLSLLNLHWAGFLDYTAYLREGIHLTVIGGKNPLEEFNISVENAYRDMQQALIDELLEKGEALLSQSTLTSLESAAISAPVATWTYLMDDSGDQFSRLPFLMKSLMDNRVKGTAAKADWKGLKARLGGLFKKR